MQDFLGFTAALLTSISFVPQVYKVWKTNNTKSISLTMFLLFWLGVLCWLIYGFLKGDMAITIANLFTLIVAGYILVRKLINLKSDNTD